MALTKVKSTYSLDVNTVQLLDSMARGWGVSKSEALRRAIRLAASQKLSDVDVRVALFDRIQQQAGLTEQDAERWRKEVRKDRQASGRKRLPV